MSYSMLCRSGLTTNRISLRSSSEGWPEMREKLSEARAKRAVISSGVVVIVLVDDDGDGGAVLSCR